MLRLARSSPPGVYCDTGVGGVGCGIWSFGWCRERICGVFWRELRGIDVIAFNESFLGIVKELGRRQEEIFVLRVDHVWGLCPSLPSLSGVLTWR